MSKTFTGEELDTLRQDMHRNPGPHGLVTVAQLHNCNTEDVLNALGLDAWPSGKQPRPKTNAQPTPKKKKRTYTAEQKKAAIAAVVSGKKSYLEASLCYDVPYKTLHTWVYRETIKSKTTITIAGPENSEKPKNPVAKKEESMEQTKESTVTKEAPAAQENTPASLVKPVALAELRRGLAGLEAFLAVFVNTMGVYASSDDTVHTLSRIHMETRAFVAGAEYMEARHD